MTHIYLIRHGQYVEGDQWHPDPGLSPEGIQQAERLRDRLQATQEISANVLITSTMARAKATADIIAPALGLSVIEDDDLCEWRNENGEGEPDALMKLLQAASHDQRAFVEPFPSGETSSQFTVRACYAINRVAEQYKGANIVIVAHGGIVAASFVLFGGMSPFYPSPFVVNAGYTSITYWQKVKGMSFDRWMLNGFNDMAHLRS